MTEKACFAVLGRQCRKAASQPFPFPSEYLSKADKCYSTKGSSYMVIALRYVTYYDALRSLSHLRR